MKTDDLIKSLAADMVPTSRSPVYRGALLVAGVAATLAVFAVIFQVRPDIVAAYGTWRFEAKLALILAAFAVAALATSRSVDPTRMHVFSRTTLAAAFAVTGAILAAEFMSSPADTWLSRAIGDSGFVCLTSIPLLAIAPLAALIWVMRDGAPQSPGMAGAAAGLLAGAIGAAIYAHHCTNDSPFYVALWYTGGIAIATAIGTLSGRRFLAW